MPVENQEVKSRCEAVEVLMKNGFTFSHKGLDREYWINTDRNTPDVFLDHSATLKKVGKTYYISMFFKENLRHLR